MQTHAFVFFRYACRTALLMRLGKQKLLENQAATSRYSTTQSDVTK